ncbi:MAG: TatD family hydrolase [Methanobacterium sp.]|uniref:TatD family hydrolase n=1 Tax=Methanobacterium sp. TaxID=2164 RepID=UPI003D64A421|nr:TatD family hydrolase [Methanobacterium sp.]
MIDSHIHADTRPYEDFEKMAVAGVELAITCAHDPFRMTTSDVVFDHWHRILNNDIKRAAENGLKLYAAIGIHPRSISKDFKRALEALPSWLKNDCIVAIGEIGLEKASDSEKEIFKRQLQLAEDLKMKVVVHTPRTNKKDVSKVTASIIEETIDPALVIIDHVDKTIVDDVIELDSMLGITVQPQKMTPDEAVSLIAEYGFEKFTIDSDISSSPSDSLSVPKTVHKMKLAGFEEKYIKKVSHDNAAMFFGI